MSKSKNRVCPVVLACGLDNGIRRWLQNPRKILEPYVQEGMTVLDLGCGPGSFSIDLARMVGPSGRIIAADLQNGMLERIRGKIRGTELEKRIVLHRCKEESIGVSEPVDFVLAFYMIHEVPEMRKFFEEIHSILKPGGKFLIVEPKLLHVSGSEFQATIAKAEAVGFTAIEQPRILFSHSMVLRKG